MGIYWESSPSQHAFAHPRMDHCHIQEAHSFRPPTKKNLQQFVCLLFFIFFLLSFSIFSRNCTNSSKVSLGPPQSTSTAPSPCSQSPASSTSVLPTHSNKVGHPSFFSSFLHFLIFCPRVSCDFWINRWGLPSLHQYPPCPQPSPWKCKNFWISPCYRFESRQWTGIHVFKTTCSITYGFNIHGSWH